MTPDRAKQILDASINESLSNAQFLKKAKAYIAGSSDTVFSYGARTEAAMLRECLELRKVSTDAALRGLIVQIVGAFELFIVNWCAAHLQMLEENSNKNNLLLQEAFRGRYISKAGNILARLPSGTYFGHRFDFEALASTLPSVLRNSHPIELLPAVLSVKLGACNSEKIESLFDLFGYPSPFRKELGSHPATKAWRTGKASATAVAKIVKGELDALVELRNELAHGAARTISHDQVSDAAKLVLALSQALDDLASE